MAFPQSERRKLWKHACLLHLKIYVGHEEDDPHLFRTLVDSWYGYERGEEFLTRKSGRPKWFNRRELANHRNKLRSMMPWISLKAMELIERNSAEPVKDWLVKDHAIPLDSLRKIIRGIADVSIESIEAALREYYHIGIITSDEHARLNKKLKKDMPDHWKVGHNPYERYRVAGIRRYEGPLPEADLEGLIVKIPATEA